MKRNHLWARILGSASLILCILGGDAVRATSDYVVRADDKLKIKIFQYPELSGEYTVSANGTIFIAAIGEVSVNGISTKEAAGRISERFVRAGLSDKPGTSVEVLQSRPVYILGDVQKPGEYPFRPGTTVLQAIGIAGGWMRFNDPGMVRLDRDTITIKGEMRNQVRQYYQLIARRARLNAEIMMKSDVQFPPELVRQSQQDSAVRQLVDEERSLLSIHVESLRNQIESLEKTRDLYEREIDAILHQIQANRTQYDSVGKELKEVKALFARGLTTSSRQLNLERMQAQIEMNEQGFQTLILRSRQNISQVDQRIFDLKNDHNAKLTSELQRTRFDIDDIGIKFETNRNLMLEAQFTTPTLVNSFDGAAVEARGLTVVRVQDGKTQTIDADENTELLPGDVLRVQRTVLPTGLDARKIGIRNLITPAGAKE